MAPQLSPTHPLLKRWPRRDFLRLAAAGGAALGFGLNPLRAFAGPFTAADFARLIPPDKKLDKKWVDSLFARGEPMVFRGAALRKIGMPVGGICAGGMYLAGDGRLWLWDIFNRNQHGIREGTAEYRGAKLDSMGGSAYVSPPDSPSPVQQGFAVRVKSKNGLTTHRLDAEDWNDVSFVGQYPIGAVEYRDAAVPVTVSLEAFSPFVPLDVAASSIPATVLNFVVRNVSAEPVDIEFSGWLENAVGLYTRRGDLCQRVNRVKQSNGLTFLECATEALPGKDAALGELNDIGSMGLAMVGGAGMAHAQIEPGDLKNAVFSPNATTGEAKSNFEQPLIGALGRRFILAPGVASKISFMVTWHFPNLRLGLPDDKSGRHYAKRFNGAQAVAQHVAENWKRLTTSTRLWRDTWYDSTLPHWFLDRTFANSSTLATTTCHRFGTGRFYAWEGVGCCEGTCAHVWHYAQAMGRLFPELERDTRERVDFGLAFDKSNGAIGYRAEFNRRAAVDGQAGRILGAFREHQMSAGDAFLRRIWPRVKQAMQYLAKQDPMRAGILGGPQENTLDAVWWGKISWTSSLYVAALRACVEMAAEMGDDAFARNCQELAEAGARHLSENLFNGEYFIQRPDPEHRAALGSYDCCHIDQVMGQSWAWQVGLGRIMAREKTRTALESLWKYNFTPDVGPFRDVMTAGRWYAMPGDGGLIMTTNPKAETDPFGEPNAWQVGYFDECMSGFEHQAASHMVAEGMLLEGLAVTRAIHDRYTLRGRNPWNEIECSDHYARAMASYGTFVSMCGFECHGPKGHLGFAPRLRPEDFKCAFTSAEGWGSFSQRREDRRFSAEVEIKWGRLRLKTLTLAPSGMEAARVRATVGKQKARGRLTREGERVTVSFSPPLEIRAGDKLRVELS